MTATEALYAGRAGVDGALNFIENAPANDVAPVVHGRWIEVEREWDFYPYFYVDFNCSVCNSREVNKRNYCPECGAKMDVPDPNTDTSDHCVCCGEIIPEGRQVCPKCESEG